MLGAQTSLHELCKDREVELASQNEKLKRKVIINCHEALKLQVKSKGELITLVQDPLK